MLHPQIWTNKSWETKISTWRRMSGPTLETIEKIDEYHPRIQPYRRL